MSNYANEAGEPYMTAAALRFEAELDAQSAEERWMDPYDEPDYDDDECDVDYDLDAHNGHAWCWTHDQNADECFPDEGDGVPEDAMMEVGLFGGEC